MASLTATDEEKNLSNDLMSIGIGAGGGYPNRIIKVNQSGTLTIKGKIYRDGKLFRETAVRTFKVEGNEVKELALIAESDESGVYMAMARNGREFFITGHSEYSPYTLDTEYKRDLAKGLPIEMPVNYYKDDNPDNAPVVRWRGHANLLFSNWLNYYVYQETPFDINQIR